MHTNEHLRSRKRESHLAPAAAAKHRRKDNDEQRRQVNAVERNVSNKGSKLLRGDWRAGGQ